MAAPLHDQAYRDSTEYLGIPASAGLPERMLHGRLREIPCYSAPFPVSSRTKLLGHCFS
jgi:hypothetical protein